MVEDDKEVVSGLQCVPVGETVGKGFGEGDGGLVWEGDAVGGVSDGLSDTCDKVVDGCVCVVSPSEAG